jgi:O-antigen/teichoic acid export membrane protein
MGIAAGSLLALTFRFGATFLWAVIGVLTARTLSVEDRGAYASIVVLASAVGGIASVGAAAGYFVSNRRRDPRQVAGNALLVAVTASFVSAACGLLLWILLPGDIGQLALVAGFLLPPIIVRSTLNGVVLGQGHLVRYNLVANLPVVVGFGLLIFVLFGWGERTAIAALVAWTLAQYIGLLALVAGSRSWWTWPLRHRPDRQLLWGMVRFTAVSGLGGVVGLLNYRIDLLLVVSLDSRESAGIYTSAIAGAEALWLFSSAIAMASFARVGAESREEAARLTATGIRHTLLIATLGAIVLAAIAPWAVVFLFGPAYEPAALPLRILCIGTLLYAPQALLNNYFANQLGRPVITLWLRLLSLTISVSAGLLLIPTYGFVGAAWATTISYLVSGLAAIGLFLWLAPVRPTDLWRLRRSDLERYPALARDIALRLRGVRS